MSDKELLQKIVGWIVVACKSQLPYDFHAKAIRDLVRVYYGYKDPTMVSMGTAHEADLRADQTKRCIDAVKQVCHKNGWAAEDELLEALEGVKDE